MNWNRLNRDLPKISLPESDIKFFKEMETRLKKSLSSTQEREPHKALIYSRIQNK